MKKLISFSVFIVLLFGILLIKANQARVVTKTTIGSMSDLSKSSRPQDNHIR